MNIFKTLQVYGKWSLKNSRAFAEEEKSLISKAEVVSSEYGNSVCFTMVGGGQAFIPLSETSTKTVGDVIDLNEAKLLTLSKQGSDDIFRVMA